MPTFSKKILLTFMVFAIAACASSSFFISYPEQFIAIKNQLSNGHANEAAIKLSEKGKGPNSLLDALESAHLSQLAGNIELSKKQFEHSFNFFSKEEQRAKLSLSEGGELFGSVAVNDNAFSYDAEAYEKIFAFHFQSFNYLSEGNIQGALVEIRRANEEQEIALENHHKELSEAENEARQKQLSPDPEQFREQMTETFKAANQVKNSFQNAYTFYYSAVIREASGDLNGAYIDYKKAFAIYPDNRFLQQDVWRLATSLQMNDDLQLYEKLIQEENKTQTQTNVIVIYEEGLIPAKVEIFLPFQTIERIHTFAFPTYNTPWQASSGINISSGSNILLSSEEIINTHALAAKALQEGAFSRLMRQMLRVNAKARIQREAHNENALAGFFGSVYSLVSERADLRSWLSLPNNVHIARFSLAEGSHKIHLRKATVNHEINVTIEQNKTYVVRVSNPANQHIYQSIYPL